jgi:hypothetical protein
VKVDALLVHSTREPVVLVEADPCGEGEIGAEANEHRTPVAIVDVEVVLHDPALGQLQVPAVFFLLTDGNQDSGRFSGFEDDDDLIGLGATKIGLDKLIAPTFGSFHDGSFPFARLVFYPVLKLLGNVTQNIAAHGVLVAIGAVKPTTRSGCWKG